MLGSGLLPLPILSAYNSKPYQLYVQVTIYKTLQHYSHPIKRLLQYYSYAKTHVEQIRILRPLNSLLTFLVHFVCEFASELDDLQENRIETERREKFEEKDKLSILIFYFLVFLFDKATHLYSMSISCITCVQLLETTL